MRLRAVATAVQESLSRILQAGTRSSSRACTSLLLSEDGIEYVAADRSRSRLKWPEIETVLWREPDYGYLGGLPYWVISGTGVTIEIEDGMGTGDQKLPQWFARKLPEFDPRVVDAAFERGYFRTNQQEELMCWSKQNVGK